MTPVQADLLFTVAACSGVVGALTLALWLTWRNWCVLSGKM
jgi:hypothetical protein